MWDNNKHFDNCVIRILKEKRVIRAGKNTKNFPNNEKHQRTDPKSSANTKQAKYKDVAYKG